MEFLRLKKMLAGVSVAAISLTQAGSVFAAYSDVPSGVWYEDAVMSFMDAGYLDASQARFRGSDPANRAEFVKLVVELNGGVLSTPPAVASFDDASPSGWYYQYFEEAGREGWVRGDNDCYGSRPCYARPGANINRAEAAALIVRAFGLMPSGDAPQFVDNPSGQWYTDVIQTAADNCVLQGDDSTGRVRPADNMNRAEMVVMLHRVDQALQYGVDCGSSMVRIPMITDVVATGPSTVEVEFNVDLDVDSGSDPMNYDISGDEDLPVDSVEWINDSTVELTLGTEMMAEGDYSLMASLTTADGEDFTDSMNFMGYTTITKGDGVLEVSLSASNPVADTVPKAAVGVVMLSADFTASCDDSVVLEHLTVLHEGFGDESDIDGLYAAINGARVTRKRTIDSEDQTSDLRFSSPLVIDACETVTIDVVADLAADADTAAEHNMVIELPSDVFGNAKEVKGNFPVRGNTFRVAAVTSGTMTVEYRSVNPTEVEVGDTGVVVGKFEVRTDSVEDQTIYSMTFEQDSSASDGDFINIAVRRTDGTVLTNTVAQSVGDFMTVVFDPPFTILEGDQITFEVIADIIGGAGDSIIIHFEESSDLFAVGSLYGYGINGQLYGSQVTLTTTPAASTVTIDAGEFTIGVSGPATQDYTSDDNDAILANIKFQTGGEDIDVKDLFVALQVQTQTGGILCANAGSVATAGDCSTAGSDDNVHEVVEDVEIRNTKTGRTIDGVRLTGSADSGQTTGANGGTWQIYRFDDFIARGEEVWELRGDFIDNGANKHPTSGDKFRAHICGEPTHILSAGALISNTTGCTFGGLISASTAYQMQVEGLSTGDKVGDVRPRGNIAGNFHRIANATLTVAVKALNTTDTAVENSKNINLLRFEARAGEAEDILITKAVFESANGSLNNGQNYVLWVDADGDGTVDTILQSGVASQSSQVTFNDIVGGGFVIPREETVLFEVHSDIASSLTDTTLQLRFATGSSVTYLEAEELDDGSNLSGLKLNGTCSVSTCDIVVTTTASTIWSLAQQGDLFVTQDTVPLRNRQLLGGALGEAVLRVQFHAENEGIDVTDLQITSSGSTASSVDRLELYKEGETTYFALATVGGCGADTTLSHHQGTAIDVFCANMESRQLVIPEGQDVDVIVRPRMKADTAGGVSDQIVQLFIDDNNDISSSSGAIRARGDESSNDLVGNDADSTLEGEILVGTTSAAVANAEISGKRNVSVLSKITSIVNANPDANGSSVPTGISPIGQFKFSAAANVNSNNGTNDAVLSGVIFTVNATNVSVDADDFKFYNKSDSTTQVACTAMSSTGGTLVGDQSGVFSVVCQNLTASSVNTEVDSGTDATFVLQSNVVDPNTSTNGNSTLQVSIQDFDQLTRTLFGVATGSSHLQWVDKDNSVSTEFTWVEYSETVVKSTNYQS